MFKVWEIFISKHWLILFKNFVLDFVPDFRHLCVSVWTLRMDLPPAMLIGRWKINIPLHPAKSGSITILKHTGYKLIQSEIPVFTHGVHSQRGFGVYLGNTRKAVYDTHIGAIWICHITLRDAGMRWEIEMRNTNSNCCSVSDFNLGSVWQIEVLDIPNRFAPK